MVLMTEPELDKVWDVVWYYEEKIIDLASRVQAVMDDLNRGLAELNADTGKTCQGLHDDLLT